jgi:hypothetical protein
LFDAAVRSRMIANTDDWTRVAEAAARYRRKAKHIHLHFS